MWLISFNLCSWVHVVTYRISLKRSPKEGKQSLHKTPSKSNWCTCISYLPCKVHNWSIQRDCSSVSTIPHTSIMGSSICIVTERGSDHTTNKVLMGKKRKWQTCCWRVSCSVGMYSIRHLYNNDCFNCHNKNVNNDHKPTTLWSCGCLHSVLILNGVLGRSPDDSHMFWPFRELDLLNIKHFFHALRCNQLQLRSSSTWLTSLYWELHLYQIKTYNHYSLEYNLLAMLKVWSIIWCNTRKLWSK